MKTGNLLEELINIAQTPKTDFAISLNMTPSGLSKILKGRRLPSIKEKRAFCRKAAAYFAEILYGRDCYLKFVNIFPVIYDFSTKYELEMFLIHAIEYAFDKDFDKDNHGNLGYADKEVSFLGKKTILNMFCVFLSDHIQNEPHTIREFYSTLPFFHQLYYDIFHRIKILSPPNQDKIILNHFLDVSSIEASSANYDISFLSYVVGIQEYVDLNLWKITKEINSSFLFLREKFLLHFSLQLDGSPLMTIVSNKGYLDIFYKSLLKKDAEKISYSGREAVAALETNPSIRSKLTEMQIHSVYNCMSIGYFVGEKDLQSIKGSEAAKKTVLEMLHKVMDKETTFFLTIDSILDFCSTGKAIVPLFGAIEIPPEERIPYLQMIDSLINDKNSNKVRIMNGKQPKVAVFCLQGLHLFYFIDHDYKTEKIHCFETDLFHDILGREIFERTIKTRDFSLELWASFLNEMSINLRGPA